MELLVVRLVVVCRILQQGLGLVPVSPAQILDQFQIVVAGFVGHVLDVFTEGKGCAHVVTELVDRVADRADFTLGGFEPGLQVRDTFVGLGLGLGHGGVDLVVDGSVGLAFIDLGPQDVDHAGQVEVVSIQLDVVALAQVDGLVLGVGPVPDLVVGHGVGGHFGVPGLLQACPGIRDALVVALLGAQLRLEGGFQGVRFGELAVQHQLVDLGLHLVGQGDLVGAGEGDGGGEQNGEENGDTNQVGLHL